MNFILQEALIMLSISMNRNSLKRTSDWAGINVTLPKFDLEKVSEKTISEPTWLHFGAGNIFRGFIAIRDFRIRVLSRQILLTMRSLTASTVRSMT